MVKLLIGGSPCTYWSIAQKKGRETEPSGIGWELFENYLIAKDRFRPDFFVYENNASAAVPIKNEIMTRLGVPLGPLFEYPGCPRYIEINSALVSAQQRLRFYVHNCGEVGQPEDRGLSVGDILDESGGESEVRYRLRAVCLRDEWRGSGADGPLRIGDIGSESQGHRVYSCYGKSVAIKSAAGGQGGKTGLYAVPFRPGSRPGKPGEGPVYEVRGGSIGLEGGEFPIGLRDGRYVIRKLTVTECERLQTLPDGYCRAVSKEQAYRGLGNGWTAEVIIHILTGALRGVPRGERIVALSMYDGIGTGRYCLDKMGFRNVEYHAFEIDECAMRVAKSNYPDIVERGDAFQVREGSFDVFVK